MSRITHSDESNVDPVRFFYEHLGRYLATRPDTVEGRCSCGSGLPVIRGKFGFVCLGCYSMSRAYQFAKGKRRLGTGYNDVAIVGKSVTLVADIMGYPNLPRHIKVVKHDSVDTTKLVLDAVMNPPGDHFLIVLFTKDTKLPTVLRMSSRNLVYVCCSGSIKGFLNGITNQPIWPSRIVRGLDAIGNGFAKPNDWAVPVRLLCDGDRDDEMKMTALRTIRDKYLPKYPQIMNVVGQVPPYGSPEYRVIYKLARNNA